MLVMNARERADLHVKMEEIFAGARICFAD